MNGRITVPSDENLTIQTVRLTLEPVTKYHAQELFELFGDEELHVFTPHQSITLEKQLERCARWAKRISPQGDEIRLNWAARHNTSNEVMGHFQAGIKQDGTASIGYLLARRYQRQGYASEAVKTIIDLLRQKFDVSEIKAFIDSRNESSKKLVQNLGFKQVDFVKNADHFKGASSDEVVFSFSFSSSPPSGRNPRP